MKKNLFCCRYIRLGSAVEIYNHYKKQGLFNFLPPEEFHVTLAYTEKELDWSTLERNTETFDYNFEHTEHDIFENYFVLKLGLCKRLHDEWQYFISKGSSWDYPYYIPHISIAKNIPMSDYFKIKPYRGTIEFEEQDFCELDINYGK